MARKKLAPLTEPPPIAYSYLRFSHPEQAKGDSVRRQEALRDAWLGKTGAVLDTSLTLEDKGVSGWTGQHRTNPDRYALAAFLELLRAGRIRRGSYLILENLDRLSREHIQPALLLVLNLLQAGIRIVQLKPAEMIFDDCSDAMQVMMMVMELSRGHNESEMKSERIGEAWKQKKHREAAENKRPITRNIPAWLRVVDEEFEVDPKKAAIVRRIYRLAIEGYGTSAITRKLNAENVPPISVWKYRKPSEQWLKSYVTKILHNRAVLGEYQPCTRRGGKRQPDGPPISNYYPAILTESEWQAAQGALASRKRKGGRPPTYRLNLFTGLLRDARDGGALHLFHGGDRAGSRPLLAPYRAMNGARGAKRISFPLETFEVAIRKLLREINPKEILPHGNGAADRVLTAEGKVADIEGRREKIKARFRADRDPSPSLLDLLEKLDAEHADAAAELAEAQRAAASPLSRAWGEFRSLDKALASLPPEEQEAGRLRLRAALRRIVETIWCLFVPRGSQRLAAIQIRFTGGICREFWIWHRPAQANGSEKRQAATWDAWSLAEVIAPGELDLRRRDHAQRLEKSLLTLELDD